ncbi:hypothetical protein DH2020_002105 [Rehmannia glutinosa]|uniref:Reverse transcriptase n=1 Tax=Rehmannia glutinosa TaxID=99300 RepID=A0ABR0XT09_REHGL
MVEVDWQAPQLGYPFFKLQCKITNCRIHLLKWSRNFKTSSSQNIDSLKNSFELLWAQGGHRDWGEWDRVKGKLNEEYRLEELFWKQKSRINWLKEGDKNSKFFHAFTMQRRKKNCILRLVDDNLIVCEGETETENIVTKFYKKLFTSEGIFGSNDILDVITHSITTQMDKDLVAPVDEAEIKRAIFNMNPYKAPGPDGMPLIFFPAFLDYYKA